MQSESLDDDFFIMNAILCWLHYFGNDHKWSDIYKELAKRDTFTTPARTQRTTRTRKSNAKKTDS